MRQQVNRNLDAKNLGTAIRLRISILFAGFLGLVVFGFLMNANLAPIRTSGGVDSGNGFTNLINIVTIPGFIISVAVVAFGANELYKIYASNRFPGGSSKYGSSKKFGKKARRTRRSSLHTQTSK